jgi:uncharacterized protein (TIGR00369 family)
MFNESHIEHANRLRKGTLLEVLGIEFSLEGGSFSARMPVNENTKQPMGLLHGGATAALAESLGSTGSAVITDLDDYAVVGTQVSANHLRGVRSGSVLAVGELLHHGRSSHVWDIRVYDDQQRLCAICRLSNLIIPKK